MNERQQDSKIVNAVHDRILHALGDYLCRTLQQVAQARHLLYYRKHERLLDRYAGNGRIAEAAKRILYAGVIVVLFIDDQQALCKRLLDIFSKVFSGHKLKVIDACVNRLAVDRGVRLFLFAEYARIVQVHARAFDARAPAVEAHGVA